VSGNAQPMADAIASAGDTPTITSQRRGWVMVLLLFAIMAIMVGCIDSTGVLFTPLLKHFGWSRARMSTVISAMSLATGLSTPVAGWFVDRIGARAVIAAGAAIAGVGLLLGSQANSFFALSAAYGLFGVGCGGASLVSASYVVANWFGDKRGIAMGVMMMGTSIGAALSAPLVSHVVAIAGWRWGLVMEAGALTVIALPLAALFLRMPVDRSARHAGPRAAGDQALSGVEVGEALRLPSFWFYCLIMFLAFVAGAAVNLHLMPFLVTDGFSTTTAAWVLSTYFIGATVAKPILGVAADRIGVRAGLCFALLMMGASCALFTRVSDHRIMFTLAATYGFGIGGPVALMPLLGAEAFGLRRYGTLMGLAALAGTGSGVIGPIATGAMFDRYGSYVPAFTVFGLLLMVASILPFLCRNSQAENDALVADPGTAAAVIR
jgi:MFS family permease